MDKTTEREMEHAFVGFDLERIKARMEAIRGSWNGKDYRFTHEDEIFTEDHVGAAEDIIALCDELQAELDNFNTL
jgi:hypothetical protein